jgi:hypothetical protein
MPWRAGLLAARQGTIVPVWRFFLKLKFIIKTYVSVPNSHKAMKAYLVPIKHHAVTYGYM